MLLNAGQKDALKRRWPRTGVLLAMLCGLYWLAADFPIYKFFEPQSSGWTLWMSFANDFFFAFGLYFFLCLGERWLKTWQIRALIAFLASTFFEFAQWFYARFFIEKFPYPLGRYLGGGFDGFDVGVAVLGVGLAVLVELQIFARIFEKRRA
ncbi:MAG: hypothetical protein IT310_08420 [Anaerolineales bacterium]|nr:hypothetical protein [Anaerolineales bacterium]